MRPDPSNPKGNGPSGRTLETQLAERARLKREQTLARQKQLEIRPDR